MFMVYIIIISMIFTIAIVYCYFPYGRYLQYHYHLFISLSFISRLLFDYYYFCIFFTYLLSILLFSLFIINIIITTSICTLDDIVNLFVSFLRVHYLFTIFFSLLFEHYFLSLFSISGVLLLFEGLE